MPASLRYGLPLAVAAVLVVAFRAQIWELVRSLLPSYAQLQVLDHEGKPLEHVQLRFFAVDTTLFGPSPTKLFAEAELDTDTGGMLELGGDYMPDEAFVVISAPGHGVDYRQLRRGAKKVRTVELGKPMQLPGIVHSVSGQPIEGARVQAIGGGDSRGPLLREVMTQEGGAFVIPDLSDHISSLLVRVLYEGYGIAEKTWNRLPTHRTPFEEEQESARLDFELRPVPPAKGRVLLPEDLAAKDLEIRVYQLAGVSTEVNQDGSFTLHHLARDDATVFRLLVANLPPGYTHPRVLVRPGDSDVTIPVLPAVTVTGSVVEAGNGRPVTNGLVCHEHGPRGGRDCPLDANGRFRLEDVPPGDIELRVTLEESQRFKEGGVRLKTVRIEDRAQQSVVLWIR